MWMGYWKRSYSKEKKANICLLFARGTITEQDFKKGLEAARSHIDFVEENKIFAQISQLRAKLGQLDEMEYDVIAIVWGGGSSVKEVFDMPDLVENYRKADQGL